MPHDVKGRKIEQGDFVKASAWYKGGKKDILQVVGVSEESQSCNVTCAPAHPQIPASSWNANEVELVLKADGSDPA